MPTLCKYTLLHRGMVASPCDSSRVTALSHCSLSRRSFLVSIFQTPPWGWQSPCPCAHAQGWVAVPQRWVAVPRESMAVPQRWVAAPWGWVAVPGGGWQCPKDIPPSLAAAWRGRAPNPGRMLPQLCPAEARGPAGCPARSLRSCRVSPTATAHVLSGKKRVGMKRLSCHWQKVPGPGFLPGCSLFPLPVLLRAPSPPAPGHGISAVLPARPFPPLGLLLGAGIFLWKGQMICLIRRLCSF